MAVGVGAVANGAVLRGTRVAWAARLAGIGAGLGDEVALEVAPRGDRGFERVLADLGGRQLRGALAHRREAGWGSTHGKALLDQQAPPRGSIRTTSCSRIPLRELRQTCGSECT